MAAGHPWLGRLVDGPRGAPVLLLAAVVCAGGWVVLALSSSALSDWAVIPAAALAGGSQPPLSPAMRARWSDLVAPHALERAYAFETTVQELGFIVGPLLLSLQLLVSTPAVAALACGAMVLVGAALFASSARSVPRAARGGVRAGARPLASAGVRALAATRCLLSAGLGVALVCIPAFAIAHGGRALAGVIIAVWSLGSLCGGLLYGSVAWRAPLPRRYVVALGLGALPMVALALAPGVAVFAAFAGMSGLGLAPWVASGDALVQRLAPPAAMTEAFTWIASLGLVGEALGAAAAGVLLDRAGLTVTLWGAGALAIAASAVAVATNGRLGDGASRRCVGNCQASPLVGG
jgi:predicted MFS family arabinose efflux permease